MNQINRFRETLFAVASGMTGLALWAFFIIELTHGLAQPLA